MIFKNWHPAVIPPRKPHLSMTQRIRQHMRIADICSAQGLIAVLKTSTRQIISGIFGSPTISLSDGKLMPHSMGRTISALLVYQGLQ